MKRLFFILLLMLSTSILFAEHGTKKISTVRGGYRLDVSVPLFPVVQTKGMYNERDYREFTDYSQAGTYKLPSLVYLFAIPEKSTVTVSAEITEQRVYENSVPVLNPFAEQKGDSAYKEIPASLVRSGIIAPIVRVSGYTYVGGFYCAEIIYSPVIVNEPNRTVTEIISSAITVRVTGATVPINFSPIIPRSEIEQQVTALIENAQFAEPLRSNGNVQIQDTTASWIQYQNNYLKMAVGRDGIYRMTGSELQAAGMSLASITPSTLRLFNRGKEIPLFLQGTSDGTFDAGDYLEFYGRINYNDTSYRMVNPDGRPYSEYMNRYTDTSYYFLTVSTVQGLRIVEQSVFRGGITDTIKDYTALVHLEKNNLYQPLSLDVQKNQDPEWTETNAWIWSYLGVDQTGSFNAIRFDFETPDVLPGKNATVRAKFISAGTNRPDTAHNLAMYFNETKLDSQYVRRNKRAVLTGSFSSSLLGGTGANDVKIRNYANGSTPNTLAYDWFEIEYPRLLKAIGDSISFLVNGNGVKNILIENVSSTQVVLYRTFPTYKKISGIQVAGNQLIYNDTLSGIASYVLLPLSKVNAPQIKRYGQFVNLRNSGRRGQYIGITHKSLFSVATEYVNYIRTQYGVAAELVDVDDVFDEFSFGYPEPESIREFMRAASLYWGGAKPEYLTLIGSASYDYKRVFYRLNGFELNANLVPSFGEPISDTWFTIWDDTTSSMVPKMYVGRIPARTPAELTHYLNKHRAHNEQKYDSWNKRALLFSGGDGNDTIQLSQIKSINDFINNSYSIPSPLALNTLHFYKTGRPRTDFGPFTPIAVKDAIEKGGLFISYIGHSGTRTWDNSINDPNQLLNKLGKGSIVTDFGCSTNKIAEPDVEAFGSLFINSGQAIAYLGNSSLGFSSTSYTVPQFFYQSLLTDTLKTVGRVHFQAKQKLLSLYGPYGSYRIFVLTNLLMGDPIIKMKRPEKSNYIVETDGLKVQDLTPDDSRDSVRVQLTITNNGSVSADSLEIKVTSLYLNQPTSVQSFKVPSVVRFENILYSIPVKGKPGKHLLRVEIDPSQRITEIYEDDNIFNGAVDVATLSVRNVVQGILPAYSDTSLYVLNPTRKATGMQERLISQFSTDSLFSAPITFNQSLDTFATAVSLRALTKERRYWFRAGIQSGDTAWSQVVSFYYTGTEAKLYYKDSYSFRNVQYFKTNYTNNGVTTGNDTTRLTIISSPGDRVKFGTIMRNGVNLLPNTFAWGMGIAVFNPTTFTLDTAKTFWYGDNIVEAQALTQFINNIPTGKLVAMNTIDDGAFGMIPELAAAIRTIGSRYIDSLNIRDAWVCFGQKGLAQGMAFERLERRNFPSDTVRIDTLKLFPVPNGYFMTENIPQQSGWTALNRSGIFPASSGVSIQPVVVKTDNSIDTLAPLIFSGNSASLTALNSPLFSSVKFKVNMVAGNVSEAPVLQSLGFNWNGLPELGINYQSISAIKDTFRIGQPLNFSFSVFNSGEVTAKNIPIVVMIQYPGNSKDTVFSVVIDSLQKGKSKKHIINYQFPIGDLQRTLTISIDPNQSITEPIKDNNTFSFPLTVLPDTTKAGYELLTDKRKALDGDFVSAQPEFQFTINDPSNLPVGDTTYAVFYLDNKRIFANDPTLRYTFSNANPKLTAVYKPTLKEGEHDLRILAKDAAGQLLDSNGVRLNFMVKNKSEIVDMYPYPNPFSGATRFTFRLTKVPQSLSINIYTVAGRLIKKITRSSAELHMDFNTVEWDGKDEDGSETANGTYLYRLIIQSTDGTKTSDGTIVRIQ